MRAQFAGAGLGLGLHLVAGADQALVGRVAVLADHDGQLAAGAQAGHAFVGDLAGDVVQRVQAAVGHDALDQHHEQDDAEGKHQLRHQVEVLDPLHGCAVSCCIPGRCRGTVPAAAGTATTGWIT